MAVARNADGRLELFARGNDNALIHYYQVGPNAGWANDWSSLGGQIKSHPVVARNGDGRLEVFAVGMDSAVWHIWQTAPNNGWSGWHSLGGVVESAPVVARNADGRLDVFTLGRDNALYHKSQGGPVDGWTDWQSLGGTVQRDVGVLRIPKFDVGRNADGRLEVFAAWADGTLRNSWQLEPNSRRPWGGWGSFGGSVHDTPAVVRNRDGRLEVVAVGDRGTVWHIWQTAPNNGWSGWNQLGGMVVSSSPAVSINGDGRLEVFARGQDDALWHTWQHPADRHWVEWAGLRGVRLAPVPAAHDGRSPTVGQNADGRLEVFVEGNDRSCWHLWQGGPNHGWSDWEQHGHWSVTALGRGWIED